jgi:hypothetical protein
MREEVPPEKDQPLPATFAFVMTMGAVFGVGWFLMFWLLASRWSN